jgi:hypothetical protein
LSVTVTGENTEMPPRTLSTVDINGAVNLGTGTLTIDTDTNAGNAPLNVNVSGNLTATAVVLKDDGAGVCDLSPLTALRLKLSSATINGETDADGNVVVANAEGVTFTGC